jgi:hypothetical protein
VVTRYTVQVVDTTGQWGVAGTQVYIYLGQRLITSGLIDTQGQFAAPLQGGYTYTVILLNAANAQYQTTVTASLTSSTINIPISVSTYGTATTTINPGLVGVFSCDGTHVTVTYLDPLGKTNSVTMRLYNNAAGNPNVLLSSQTFSIAGQTSKSITVTVGQSASANYYVTANATRSDGTFPQLGPFAVSGRASGCPGVGPAGIATPNIPNQVLGLDAILPNGNAWLNLVSLFILFMTAALFGARAASLGAILVALEAAVLVYFQWLPFSVFLLDMFLIAPIVVYIAQRARRRFT